MNCIRLVLSSLLSSTLCACGGGGGGSAQDARTLASPATPASPEASGVAAAPPPAAVQTPPAAAAPADAAAGPRAFQDGSRLVLEQRRDGQVARIALDLTRGGFVSELSLDGVNVVNAHDTGRGVQVALYDSAYRYDGCAGCSGQWGWNPVQGGDQAGLGSPVTEARADAAGLFTRTRLRHWKPGAAALPALSEVTLEQRVAAVEGEPLAFRVDFSLLNESSLRHESPQQELPAAYANALYRRVLAYGGTAPWTGAPWTAATPGPLGEPHRRWAATERWVSLVDEQDFGLTLYAPGGYGMASGFVAPGSSRPDGAGTVYAVLDAPLALEPGQRVEGHYYLLVGAAQAAREAIYRLHAAVPAPDMVAPRLFLDAPGNGERWSGRVRLAGWAYDNNDLASLRVSVDGVEQPALARGLERPDVPAVFPDTPADVGFALELDSTAWPNGAHRVAVVAVDRQGHRATAEVQVQVAN